MDSLYNYITDPWTLVSLVVFVFWLWATWSSLNARIKELEKRTDEIDVTKIETKLAEIQTDLQRIKEELNKSRRNTCNIYLFISLSIPWWKNKYINIKMTGLFSDLMRKIWIGEKTEEANTGLEVNGSLD